MTRSTPRRTLLALIVTGALAVPLAGPALAEDPGRRAETGGSDTSEVRTVVASERYGGAASGRAVEVGVGQHVLTLGAGLAAADLDPVHDVVDALATGIGSVTDPETVVAAGMGESREGCAVPEVALGSVVLDAEVVCGLASVEGRGEELRARGAGRLAGLSVPAGELLSRVLDDPALEPIADQAFGELAPLVDAVEETADEEVDPGLATAVGELDERLDTLVGDVAGESILPALDASDTLDDLLDRLSSARLVDLGLGEAASAVESGADELVARSSDDGATVSLLGGFFPDGRPLAEIAIGSSDAEVVYDRAEATAAGSSRSALVTVSSPFLPEPVELAAGERLELFCDEGDLAGDLGGEVLEDVAGDVPGEVADGLSTLGTLLCSEVAVGAPSEEEVDGRLRVESSLVTVHLAKGLEVPSLPSLPPVQGLVPGAALDLLNGALAEHGLLDEGVATAAGSGSGTSASGSSSSASPAGGVRIVVAGATAEAGGAKVLERTEIRDPEAFQGSLPRTGAASLAGPAVGLFGAAAGLRFLLRRLR